MTEQLRLDGKVALVTGGASGMGEAHSRLLAERGASVVINGNFRPDGHGPEQTLAEALQKKGFEAVGVNGSVRDEDAVQRMVATAIDAFGRLDIVVNCAGNGGIKQPIYELPGPNFEDQIELHVAGSMRVVRAAWPHLAASGAGRVLNIGSSSAFGYEGANEWNGTYSIAKGAMFTVTRQMAGAGAVHGIKVNMALPWGFTPLIARGIGPTEQGQWVTKNLDVNLVPRATLPLLHDRCPVTGQFFTVGGGRVARIAFASADGYFNPKLEPEDVLAHWDEAYGTLDAEGHLQGMFDVLGTNTEYAYLKKLLGS